MRRALAMAVVLACAVGAAGAVRAEEPPIAARVPIVVVDAGRQVDRGEVDAVEQGLGAPALRGAELARALASGAGSPLSVDSEEIATRFAVAQDVFFAGDHAAARQGFESLVARIEDDPCALALLPALRRIGFDSRLYLAIVARGDADEVAVQDLLAGAARIYPGLQPEPADFPPWICEAHGRAAGSEDPSGGAAGPDAGRRCVLPFDGGRVIAAVDRADLRVAPEEESTEAELFNALAALARAGGWPRIVAAIGRPDALELVLIDAVDVQVARRVDDKVGVALATGAALATSSTAPSITPPELGGESEIPGTEARGAESDPWYRNGLAWAVTGAGLAIAGTGFALGRAYGTPSTEEPAAWALMAAGAGVAGTGLVLFFLPAPTARGDEGEAVAIGLSGSIRF